MRNSGDVLRDSLALFVNLSIVVILDKSYFSAFHCLFDSFKWLIEGKKKPVLEEVDTNLSFWDSQNQFFLF